MKGLARITHCITHCLDGDRLEKVLWGGTALAVACTIAAVVLILSVKADLHP